MIGDVLLIEKKHERVARELASKVNKRQFSKLAIAIGGESGSGKSEIAETLRHVLGTEGYKVKILHLDNYYKVSPDERNEHRHKYGMDAVGLHEINWEVLDENIAAFRNGKPTTIPFLDLYTNQEDKLVTDFKNIDILILEGLYACNCPSDINVLIDLTYHDTKQAQIKRKKEKVDEFRFNVLEKEHQEVLTLRPKTDYFVNPNFILVDNTDKYSPLEEDNSARLILCSHTLPIQVKKTPSGYTIKDNNSGVENALSSIYGGYDSIWFGGCNTVGTLTPSDKTSIKRKLKGEKNWSPIFFKEDECLENARKFCSRSLWPLFHYFTESCEFREEWWQDYKKFNQRYYQRIKKTIRPNDTIWVHNYQLLLLPKMIRNDFPDVTIGFFLHTPFPSYELFRMLPWREEILEGVIGADLIGFHIYEYTRHFQSSVFRTLGYDTKRGHILADDHLLHTDSFSLGVDFSKYETIRRSTLFEKELTRFEDQIGNCKIVLSIDRLDSTRGILNQLETIDMFFETNTKFRKKVQFQIKLFATAIEDSSTDYKKIIQKRVSQINERFKSGDWEPVACTIGNISQEELVALYNLADVLLVASMRDGMNLICKEYFAAREANNGVVVLSEFAGGSRDLSEAIHFNPNNQKNFVDSIRQAIEMPATKRESSFKKMKERLQRNTAMRWSVEFIEGLKSVKINQAEIRSRKFNEKIRTKMLADYHTANNRLIILDYNGTLVPMPKSGKSSPPNSETLEVMSILAENKHNKVVVITDNKRDRLQKWFMDPNIDLIACSDAAIRQDGEWNVMHDLSDEWKDEARPILEKYAVRTPGSYIEEKNYSMIWHFENAIKELGEVRSRELIDDLKSFTASENSQLHEGARLIEIKSSEAYKGKMLHLYLEEKDWEFIFASGDDWSNEYMFQHLPEHAYTLRVGSPTTNAKYNTREQSQILKLLQIVANIRK